MRSFKFTPTDSFFAMGRGEILTGNIHVHPFVSDVSIGDRLITPDGTYLVKAIEQAMKLCYPPKPGDNFSFVVTKESK